MTKKPLIVITLVISIILIIIFYATPEMLYGTHGISESVNESKRLNLLVKNLKPIKRYFYINNECYFTINESFYERNWRCGEGCKSVLEVDMEAKNGQLIIKCSKDSKLKGINSSWYIEDAKGDGLFSTSGDNGLVYQYENIDTEPSNKFFIVKKQGNVSFVIDSIKFE